MSFETFMQQLKIGAEIDAAQASQGESHPQPSAEDDLEDMSFSAFLFIFAKANARVEGWLYDERDANSWRDEP